MNEALHPLQWQAVNKLKGLRVGALYMDRQEGKMRTVAQLIRYRLEKNKIDGVLWLATHRRLPLLQAGIQRYLSAYSCRIFPAGIECLSHALDKFKALMALAEEGRMMLIIDNGLLIKNIRALRTQRVIALSQRCPYRLLISDLPFTCHAADIFAQWYALDWRILGYRSYWGFCLNHMQDGKRGLRNTDYLARAIAPYCVQVQREEIQAAAGRSEYVWKFSLPPAAMAEYKSVMQRFLVNGLYSNTGVYQLLQACQHVICGRRVLQDYPLVTASLYASPAEDPRLQALMEVLHHFPEERILILCRYHYEMETIFSALSQRFGPEQISRYPFAGQEQPHRLMLMNVFADERENARLKAQVMIYYSNEWNWRKRQEKERQCQNALGSGTLMIVSLAAADTVDILILRSIWKKESLINQLRKELMTNT